MLTAVISFALLAGCAQPDPAVRLEPVIDAFVEVWNTGDYEVLDRICDPNFELHVTPGYEVAVGLDSLKAEMNRNRTMFPDFHVTIDDRFYTETAVFSRWTVTGTNTGPGLIPPTGKKITTQGMSLLYVEGGKVTGGWIAKNNLSWMKQLGFSIIPPDFVQGEN
jgi:predicted ester cyclase